MQLTFFPEEKFKKLGHTFGLFFEDLNHAADGGIYAEMLRNRDFEFSSIDHKLYHALTACDEYTLYMKTRHQCLLRSNTVS